MMLIIGYQLTILSFLEIYNQFLLIWSMVQKYYRWALVVTTFNILIVYNINIYSLYKFVATFVIVFVFNDK